MRSLGMRIAVFVALAACGAPPVATTPPRPAPAAPVATPADPPLEVLVVDADGNAKPARWTEQLAQPKNPDEDVGVFGFAQRKTVLHSGDQTIGWLEPGARVGVTAVQNGRAAIALFAWTGSSLSGRVLASVDARDLGPAPPPNAPPFSHATHAERTIGSGQILTRADDEKIGYTFCGNVEVVAEDEHGVHVVQREDGIALEANVSAKAWWADQPCAGLLVVDDYKDRRSVIYHERWRRFTGPTPPELVEVVPFRGPTFAKLVAKRAPIFWLDDSETPQCSEWKPAPPKTTDDTGELVMRTKESDGTRIVVTFGLNYGPEPDASVTILGPSSQMFEPNGHPAGGMSMGCGASYTVVASEPEFFTMHRRAPSIASHIRAYDPHDTERWYTSRASCQRDAEARQKRVAAVFEPHHGC